MHKRYSVKWIFFIIFSTNIFQASAQTNTPVYVIPVVFHIISTNPYSLPDSVILKGLQDLNDAFAHAGAYASGAPGANTAITFCIAKTDPDGGITNGITRTQSVLGNFDKDIEDDKLKNLVSWDTKKYCNIWFVDGVQDESYGAFNCGVWVRAFNQDYATFEGDGKFTDGIVTSSFGVPLTYLMGIYLGLKSTYALGNCTNNNCLLDGDGICDTPPSSVAGGSCTNPQNSCSSDTISGFINDVPDLSSNFMSSAGCANEFTQGQAIKMRSNIATVRSGMIAQSECDPPCNENILANFTRDNWAPKIGDDINFTSTSTGGANYQWSVDSAVVGGNSPNYSQAFNATGKFKVTLKVYNADANCYSTYSDFIIVNCGVMARFDPNVREVEAKAPLAVDSILFTNRSVNASLYQWWMSNDAGMPAKIVGTNFNLNYIFTVPGNYSVWLVASNGSCFDTTEKFNFPVFDPTQDGVMYLNDVECYQQNKVLAKVQVCNIGYATIPANMPITFYDADPRTGNANKLGTFFMPQTIVGNCCSSSYPFVLNVSKPGLNQLFAVFNDSGTTKPFTLPGTSMQELTYTNNIASVTGFQLSVTIDPATATLEPGDTLILSATAGPGVISSYVWSTAQDISCTNCDRTMFIAEKKNITKQVIATNTYGCADTATILINIPPADDYVIHIDSIRCSKNDSLLAWFTICNQFNRGIVPQGLKVGFYDADPSASGANLLGPLFVTNPSSLQECFSFVHTIKAISSGTIYAVVNDSLNITPVSFPQDTLYLEKDYSNNVNAYAYSPDTVSLQPSDTSVFKHQTFPITINTTIYDPSTTEWFAGNGYSLNCSGCPSPLVTVTNNSVVQMQTANQYGCLIKGQSIIKIFPPDMTVQMLSATCYSNTSTLVKFRICMNNAYDSIFANIPVSFYNGDPSKANEKLLFPIFYTSQTDPVSCDSFTFVVNTDQSQNIYAVVNDKGDNASAIPDKAFDETDYTNNMSNIAITPFLAQITPSDTTIFRNTTIQLLGSVTGGQPTSYTWQPVEFLSCSNCAAPYVTPPYSMKYEFIAKNEFKCIDTAYADIKTFAAGIVDIPNAFTPNGDGHNDVFFILGNKDVVLLKEFAIFNRWGQKMFEETNVPSNDPQYGWNGLTNGRKAEAGTYVYFVKVQFSNGSIQLYKGPVVLIR